MVETTQKCADLLRDADAVVIGAGAGLTAAAGINYTDREKFAEVFPAWVKRGFSMQYQLMGYTGWTEMEKWGYYAVHLNYVYFQQGANPLYEQLRQIVGDKEYFVMTSNVDELFHKSGFDAARIYTPQGSYGRIQCEIPCRPDSLWEMRPFFDKMQQALDPVAQVLTDADAVPRCPNCGGSMFVNARIDHSFIETPYQQERQRLIDWFNETEYKRLVLLELGAGYNTPVVIRMPMENFAAQIEDSALIRVNMEYAEVPDSLNGRGISVRGDIKGFIEEIGAA